MTRDRRRALWRGLRAEIAAAFWLRLKGWRVLERNFRCRQGEIDIVARKGDLIAFVEVKARADAAGALDAVGPGTKRRVADAGMVWISRQPGAERLSWRCDIVAIAPWRLPRHFEDAF